MPKICPKPAKQYLTAFSHDYNIGLIKNDNAKSDKDDKVDNDNDEGWGRLEGADEGLGLEGADQTGGNICNIQYNISDNIPRI